VAFSFKMTVFMMESVPFLADDFLDDHVPSSVRKTGFGFRPDAAISLNTR
jgi:hypothetical protein